jgi:hypothetical protein
MNNERPLLTSTDHRRTPQRLQTLFSQLLVENDQGRIIREKTLALKIGRFWRAHELGEGRHEAANGLVTAIQHPKGPGGEPAVVRLYGLREDLVLQESEEYG